MRAPLVRLDCCDDLVVVERIGQALGDRLAGDGERDGIGNFTDLSEWWKQCQRRFGIPRNDRADGGGRCAEHRVADLRGADRDHPATETREQVEVVDLSDRMRFRHRPSPRGMDCPCRPVPGRRSMPAHPPVCTRRAASGSTVVARSGEGSTLLVRG